MSLKNKALLPIILIIFGLGVILATWLIYQSFVDPTAGVIVAETQHKPNDAQKSMHPVYIRKPNAPPTIATDEVDFHGNPVSLPCSTCHTDKPPNPATQSAEELDQFHKGLEYRHGNLTCLSCHNPSNYNELRKADGTALKFQEVMQLCAQCHGTQARDYHNGSHGGMAGFWDLRKGARVRNNCIDCHDPHAPAYSAVMPVFPPRDRLDSKHP